MEQHYKTLGVKETATDEEIKKAYIKLKRKYDESSYEKEDFKKHAKEKTKEIDFAFDTIMNERRAKQIENKEKKGEEFNEGYTENPFKNVEDLIEDFQLQRAQDILMNVPQEKRTARWYYLRGVILFKKGWLMEASNFFSTAVKMDPSNEEYQEAYRKACLQRSGSFENESDRPFRDAYPPEGPMNCSMCDVCSAVMCMDLCCNCGAPRGPYRGGC